MFWLFGSRRLNRLGVLGMNRRNAEFLLEENPRALHPLVDDKLQMHALCRRLGVPTPEVHAVVRSLRQRRDAVELMAELGDFVVKPVRGASGRGVVVSIGASENGFARPNGSHLSRDDMNHHLAEILSGMYSLGGRTDSAIIQERIRVHPLFERISYRGIPDVRVLVHRGVPVMAMLRLATLESNGRANLHQGGIGVGIDLETGSTFFGVRGDRRVDVHPDTAEPLSDRTVPHWGEIMAMAATVSRAVGMGYLGVDIVLDARRGPLLLEANARPGLAIQIACRRGLLPELKSGSRPERSLRP